MTLFFFMLIQITEPMALKRSNELGYKQRLTTACGQTSDFDYGEVGKH